MELTSPNIRTSLYNQEHDHKNNNYYAFNKSIADSADYTELELRTLDNSEQRRIMESHDRRGTMNIIPNLVNLKNFNESAYQRDSDYNPRGSGSNFMRLNSHGTYTDVNQSRKFNFDVRNEHMNRSAPFDYIQHTPSSVQIPLNSKIPKQVHDKFGSLIVTNPKKPFHRNSFANISHDQLSLFQQKRRQRINSHHVSSQFFFNPSSPMTPQKLSNHPIKTRKSFKVHSLPHIPDNIKSIPSTDIKEQKKSIFGLKSIKEKHEDEPERKISQSFDGQNSMLGNKDQQLFAFSKNSHSHQKSKHYSKNKLSMQSSSNISQQHLNSTKNKNSLFKFSQNTNNNSDNETSLFANSMNTNKKGVLLKNFRSFEVEDENIINKQNMIVGKGYGELNNNKEILADLDIVLQKKKNESETNLLRILSPKNKTLGLDLYVNSKSLRKESLTLGKSRSSFIGDNYKISPKIQKKKNLKRKRKKEQLQKSTQYAKNNNKSGMFTNQIIHDTSHPQSIDSSNRIKSSSLFKFTNNPVIDNTIKQNILRKGIFDNKIPSNKKKFLNLKLQKKIINQSGSEKKLLSPMSHFLSPHPAKSTKSHFLFNSTQKLDPQYRKYQINHNLKSKFLSNQKIKTNKYYSLTPNPKNNSKLSNKKGLFDQLKSHNYNQKIKESTPPIRNSNIINSSSYEVPLLSDNSKSLFMNNELFVPKKISTRGLTNDLNLSHSGAPSSSFMTNNISGRQLDPTSNRVNSQIGIINMINNQNPFKSNQMSNMMQMQKNIHPGTYQVGNIPQNNTYVYQKEFPLVIPQQNQMNYATIRNSNDLFHSRTQPHSNFGNGANLMTFLDPRGSKFQRQFEQKIFENKQKQVSEEKSKEKTHIDDRKGTHQRESKEKEKKKNGKRRRKRKNKNKKKKDHFKYDHEGDYYDRDYNSRDYYDRDYDDRDYYSKKRRRGTRRYY